MKLRCIHALRQTSSDVFGLSPKITESIPGLTVGKVYSGEIVPINDNVFGPANILKKENMRFFLYNDKKQWDYYDMSLFEPADD